jgi:mannosyltransferase
VNLHWHVFDQRCQRPDSAAEEAARETSELATTAQQYRILVAAVTAVALVLRLAFLEAKSFDLDEAVSITYARFGWVSFRHAVSEDANMLLYYGLLRLWRHLGESEAAIRFLSIIPAVATVPVVYALGARLFSNRVGLIAAVLLCVNASHIRYAQEARSYSLVVLLVVLSCLFLIRALEHPSRRDMIGYVTVGIFAIYSHFFAALVLLAQCVSLAIPRPRRVPLKALLMSFAAIGSLSLPLAFFAVTRDFGQVSWIVRPTLQDIIQFFRFLTGGGKTPAPLLGAYLAAWLAAVVGAGKVWRSGQISWQAWRYGLLLSWMWTPILLTLLISTIKPLFVSYYLIVCLPPLVLLTAASLSWINHRWLLAGALAVVVGLALLGDYHYYTNDRLKDDFRGATSYVLTHAQPEDAIVFVAKYVQHPFEYYRSRLPRTAGGESMAILPPNTADEWKRSLRPYERVWLFLSHDQYVPAIARSVVASLAERYPTMVERTFYGVRVRLYSRRAEAAEAR